MSKISSLEAHRKVVAERWLGLEEKKMEYVDDFAAHRQAKKSGAAQFGTAPL